MKRAFTLIELMIVIAIVGIVAAIGASVISEAHKKDPERLVVSPPVEGFTGTRFKIEKQGWFNAGFKDNPREILLITDTVTGVTYLAITGCGTTELRVEKSGKTHVTLEE